MPRINSAGPAPIGDGQARSLDRSAATVQLGESKLADVAQRLGVDENSLHAANPQISDAKNLKVGQDIHLPQFQSAQTLNQDDEAGLQNQGLSDLPRAAVGDPVTKNAILIRLSAANLASVDGGAQLNSTERKIADKATNATKATNANLNDITILRPSDKISPM